MATKAGTAVFKIALDAKQYKVAIKGIQKSSKKTATSLRGISQAVGVAIFAKLATVGVRAVGQVASELKELATRGAEVSALKGSFDSLTRSVDTTGQAMLGELRTATKGLVDDMTLMGATNKAVLLGLPVTTESMGTMAEAATVLGRAMGQDAAKSLDDLTTALGRGSPLILDNLGLTVKVSEANEAYAVSLGKSVSELTEAEKKMAFYNAAMEAARSKAAELGEVHLTFGDRLNQTEVFLANFRDSLAVAVAQSPVLAAGMEALSEEMSRAFGGSSQNAVQTVMGFIIDLAIGFTHVAQAGAVGATVLVTAWFAVKAAVLGVITAIAAVATAQVSFIAGLAELGAKIPLVGEKVKGFAAGANALSRSMKGVTVSLAEQTAEAGRGVLGNSELQGSIDKVHGAALGLRDVMVHTKTASRDASTAIRDVGAASIQMAAEGAAAEKMAAAEIERLAKKRAADAQAAATLIANTERTLQQELALANSEGLQQRLLEIGFAQEKELEQIASLRTGYADEYEQLAAMIKQKYDEIRADAQAAHMSIQAAANEQGFKTREQLEETARKAEQTYRRMLASGKFTIDTLENAHQTSEEAKRQITGGTVAHADVSLGAMVSSATGALRDLFGQNKAVAIATAIADTAAAVVASFKNAGGWPWGLIPAAAMAAAGAKRISTIRSTDPGLKFGTPGLDFQNFGMVTPTFLHRQEAVIPRGRGHLLAGEIAAAMPGADVMQLAELRGIRDELTRLPRAIGRQVRQGMLLSQ